MQDDRIYIEKNCVRYHDDIIKISNISRMYITKFYNEKKHQYNEALSRYEYHKKWHEDNEKQKKRNRVIGCIVLAVVCLLAAVVIPYQKIISFPQFTGTSLIVAACIFLIFAVIFSRKNTAYKQEPPQKEPFPDTHGLFIELNSGNSVVFTAVDDMGRDALRSLRDQINKSDVLRETVTFNMVDNHIEVETNEGVVSLGGHTKNTVNRS